MRFLRCSHGGLPPAGRREKSVQVEEHRVIDCRLPLRAEPAIKLTKAHRLGKDSTFIDVGSGYGKARSAAPRRRRVPSSARPSFSSQTSPSCASPCAPLPTRCPPSHCPLPPACAPARFAKVA